MSSPTTVDEAHLAYLAHVRPSARQRAWQALEFYGFLHVGMNTMTDREWGDGTEDPASFDPERLDADQWVQALASAGMRAAILTAKHHDGFCLWPTATTTHSVASSPWRDGRGDLVREVAEACARHGLRFGVYLSPWDRNHPAYGSGAAYDDVYVAQLTELLTGYGDVCAVWLDGANGEGPDGRVQQYDWDRYYRTVRALQPDAVISVCGPDVRWCGNEAGHTRPDEWSVVPRALQSAERTAERSQQADDGEFARLVRSDEDDLGSRAALGGTAVGDLVWYPAEVNTSIRPGWFHHPAEDDQVRSARELLGIHERSVGGNATFLLNVPPARDGLVADADVAVLAELGRLLAEVREHRVGGSAAVHASSGTGAEAVTDPDDAGAWWQADAADPEPTITLDLPAPARVQGVLLQEHVAQGQRVEEAVVEHHDGTGWRRLARVGAVGYRRVARFAPVEVQRVRVRVTASRLAPTLSGVALYGAGGPVPEEP